MKICYLTHNVDPRAGWGRYASELVRGVKRKGHEVVILKEQDDGLDGIVAIKRSFGLAGSILRCIRHAKDCDIIHALDVYPYAAIAYFANIFLRKKILITAQGTYAIEPLHNTKTKFISRLACNAADAIVAISNFTKQELLKKVGNKKIEVINHGINLEEFYKKHIETEEKFILSVGALKYRKGYHISIPAYAVARKKFPHLRYKIVGSHGDSYYFGQLKNLVAQHGIEDGVEFLSGISDVELGALYQSARLFMLTPINHDYHFEGFGLVFLEAAAAGLPVIGTLGNGTEDAVKNGHNGILVPQNDINKTSAAILDVLSNGEKWRTMNKHSYEWAHDHDSKKVVRKYISLYEEIFLQ